MVDKKLIEKFKEEDERIEKIKKRIADAEEHVKKVLKDASKNLKK